MKRLLTPATTLTTLRKIAFTLFCCTVLMVFAATAQTPPTLVGAPTPIASGSYYGMYPNGSNSQAAQFTLSGSAYVTTIDVVLLGNGTYDFSLQNSLPGTPIATATLTAPNEGPNTVTMPVNATLPAGTYYLVGTGDPESNLSVPGWYISDGTTFITNAGSVTNGVWYSDSGPGGSWFFETGSSCDDTCYYYWAPRFVVYGSLPSQTQTLQPGKQAVYSFDNGANIYKITPSPFSTGGEVLTITEVPILESNYVPPANFPNETCIPVANFTALNGADTCVEYQADCSFGGVPNGGDCNTLLYTLMESYDLPPNRSEIGGPDFLVVHGKGCPTSGNDLAQSIFTDYYVTKIDPTTKGGGSGLSCFEVMYTPGAPLITSGTTSSFIGFEFPVSNTRLNPVFIPLPVWLSWDYRNSSSGNPVTNLSLCNNTNGLGCTAPWVNLGAIPIACPSGRATGPEVPISSLFNAGLLNFGRGEYAFPWNTGKGFRRNTCAIVVLTFDSGLVEYPATFQFH